MKKDKTRRSRSNTLTVTQMKFLSLVIIPSEREQQGQLRFGIARTVMDL